MKQLSTGKIEITAHNHNFAVDPDSLKQSEVDLTHIDLNDNTLEGLRHRSLPLFSVQYHPEAAPGPHDSHYLFKDFVKMMEEWKGSKSLTMPRRNDIAKVLIIGSGPIVIGQSAEFDYSGAQACKALKSEGYEVVLANSNPATIMTDPEMADRTYIEPLTRTYLEEIIRVEAEMLTASGTPGIFAAAADGRRTDRAEPRGRTGRQRRAREVRRAADRRAARRDQEGRRPPAVQRCDDRASASRFRSRRWSTI